MDDISEIVYVADIETHELLYLNDSGRRLFGVEDIAGRTCHAVLQGSNTPCCFCTNTRLRHEENYTWERINPLTNHRYLLKDRLIDWQGRTARLEVAFDMTASSNGQADFRIALDAESMVLQCARDLNAAHELASATDGMLRRLGAFLRADRAHMFGVRGDRIFGVREWCAIGGPSRLRNLETIKEATLRRWERFFSRGECVVIDDIEELREAQPVEYAFLKDHGIDAVAAVALGAVERGLGVSCEPAEKPHQEHPIFAANALLLLHEHGAPHREREEAHPAELSRCADRTVQPQPLYERYRFPRRARRLARCCVHGCQRPQTGERPLRSRARTTRPCAFARRR